MSIVRIALLVLLASLGPTASADAPVPADLRAAMLARHQGPTSRVRGSQTHPDPGISRRRRSDGTH